MSSTRSSNTKVAGARMSTTSTCCPSATDEPKTSYAISWDLTVYDPETCLDAEGRRMPAWWVIETDHPDAPVVTLVSGDLRTVDRLQVGIPSLGAALDRDGRRLFLSAAEPGGVLMVGPRLGTIIRRWSTPVGRFVAVDPDGRKLYVSGGAAGTLIVVDRIAGRLIGEICVGRSAGDPAVVP